MKTRNTIFYAAAVLGIYAYGGLQTYALHFHEFRYVCSAEYSQKNGVRRHSDATTHCFNHHTNAFFAGVIWPLYWPYRQADWLARQIYGEKK